MSPNVGSESPPRRHSGLAKGLRMEVPSLRDLFWTHRGLLSDKWEQYIPIYESELRPYLEREAPVVLLRSVCRTAAR